MTVDEYIDYVFAAFMTAAMLFFTGGALVWVVVALKMFGLI